MTIVRAGFYRACLQHKICTVSTLTLTVLPSLSTTPTQAQGSVSLLFDTSTNSPTCSRHKMSGAREDGRHGQDTNHPSSGINSPPRAETLLQS